jgi:hypothetical protein
MNVEVGTAAAQFPEKKYINGIFVALSERSLDQASKEPHNSCQLPSVWFLLYAGGFYANVLTYGGLSILHRRGLQGDVVYLN